MTGAAPSAFKELRAMDGRVFLWAISFARQTAPWVQLRPPVPLLSGNKRVLLIENPIFTRPHQDP